MARHEPIRVPVFGRFVERSEDEKVEVQMDPSKSGEFPQLSDVRGVGRSTSMAIVDWNNKARLLLGDVEAVLNGR